MRWKSIYCFIFVTTMSVHALGTWKNLAEINIPIEATSLLIDVTKDGLNNLYVLGMHTDDIFEWPVLRVGSDTNNSWVNIDLGMAKVSKYSNTTLSLSSVAVDNSKGIYIAGSLYNEDSEVSQVFVRKTTDQGMNWKKILKFDGDAIWRAVNIRVTNVNSRILLVVDYVSTDNLKKRMKIYELLSNNSYREIFETNTLNDYLPFPIGIVEGKNQAIHLTSYIYKQSDEGLQICPGIYLWESLYSNQKFQKKQTWNADSSLTCSDDLLFDVDPLSGQMAIARVPVDKADGTLLISADFGNTWETSTIDKKYLTIIYNSLLVKENSVKIIGNFTLWNSKNVLETVDNGQTWNTKTIKNLIELSYYKTKVIDGELYYYGSQKANHGLWTVLKYHDNEWRLLDVYSQKTTRHTYTLRTTTGPNNEIYSVGYVGGSYNRKWLTVGSLNGGKDWNVLDIVETGPWEGRFNGAHDIVINKKGEIFVSGKIGDSGVIRKSEDHGQTWTTIFQHSTKGSVVRTLALDKLDNLLAVVHGEEPNVFMEVLKQSSDQLKWSNLHSIDLKKTHYNLEPIKIKISASNDIFIVGRKTLKTPYKFDWFVYGNFNGEQKWQWLETNVNNITASAKDIDIDPISGKIYVVGSSMQSDRLYNWLVRESSDYGKTWKTIDDFRYDDYDSVAYSLSVNNGVVSVAGYGYSNDKSHWLVRQTSNSGKDWSIVDDYVSFNISSASHIHIDSMGRMIVTGQGNFPQNEFFHGIVRVKE